jgi:hypothetical protein
MAKRKTAEQAAEQVAEILRRAELRAQVDNEVQVLVGGGGELIYSVVVGKGIDIQVLNMTEAQALALETKLQDVFRMEKR